VPDDVSSIRGHGGDVVSSLAPTRNDQNHGTRRGRQAPPPEWRGAARDEVTWARAERPADTIAEARDLAEE
jgi:hypothetical protein